MERQWDIAGGPVVTDREVRATARDLDQQQKVIC